MLLTHLWIQKIAHCLQFNCGQHVSDKKKEGSYCFKNVFVFQIIELLVQLVIFLNGNFLASANRLLFLF